MSTQSSGATAVSAEPQAYTIRPTVKARRRPVRSPILPPVSMKAAITRVYRVIAPWIAVTSVWKSCTSWLMDTFITEVSSTMRNWVAPRTMSARQRCTGSLLRPAG